MHTFCLRKAHIKVHNCIWRSSVIHTLQAVTSIPEFHLLLPWPRMAIILPRWITLFQHPKNRGALSLLFEHMIRELWARLLFFLLCCICEWVYMYTVISWPTHYYQANNTHSSYYQEHIGAYILNGRKGDGASAVWNALVARCTLFNSCSIIETTTLSLIPTEYNAKPILFLMMPMIMNVTILVHLCTHFW